MRKTQLNCQLAFGLAVRSLRIKAGLSQEQLADAAGLHRTYVGSVERGERNISLMNISSIALSLDCSMSDLLALTEQIAKEEQTPERRRK